MKTIITLLSLLLMAAGTSAQTPFDGTATLDINKLKVWQGLHGDMWHYFDSIYSMPGCEFPAGSGKHLSIGGGLWMAGYNAAGELRGAATLYRESGQEYWPGPLDNASNTDYVTSGKWARIWKIDRATIDAFKAIQNHTVANTPAAILEWPGKGNTYAKGNNGAPLTYGGEMAPFTDVNADQVYNPLDGDYPALKGDQMLWYVFNDAGPSIHNELTNLLPAYIQVRATVYGYNRGTLLDNVVYYEYDLDNKGIQLDSFCVGMGADPELGLYWDDYIGYDSSRNMAYVYNGTPSDQSGPSYVYKDTIPMMGFRLLEFPGSGCSGTVTPPGSFMYFLLGSPLDPQGNPSDGQDVYGYMRHTWADGSPLRKPATDSAGQIIHTNGFGPSGARANYAYDGKPVLNNIPWQECQLLEDPDDRKMALAAAPVQFPAGASMRFSFALLASDPQFQNGCPTMDFTALNAISDSAALAFCNPPLTSIAGPGKAGTVLRLYPNPAGDDVTVEVPENSFRISVVDMMGRVVADRPLQATETSVRLDLRSLVPGRYVVLAYGDSGIATAGLIRQ